jgi:hypothetical protein
MVNAGRLERLLNEIRDTEQRQEQETIDAFLKRTWRMALARLEQESDELPHVVEGRERTKRLLAEVGKPERK